MKNILSVLIVSFLISPVIQATASEPQSGTAVVVESSDRNAREKLVTIEGDAAAELFIGLSQAAVTRDFNDWGHERITRTGKNIRCVLSPEQQGIEVHTITVCTLKVSRAGAISAR